MKRNTARKNSDYNISFWFVVLWPLIVVAIAAIGFLAPALIKTLWRLGSWNWGAFRNSIPDVGNCAWSACRSLPRSKR